MATKYGQAAIDAWNRTKAEFKARKLTIGTIVAIGIVYMVVDYYIF